MRLNGEHTVIMLKLICLLYNLGSQKCLRLCSYKINEQPRGTFYCSFVALSLLRELRSLIIKYQLCF